MCDVRRRLAVFVCYGGQRNALFVVVAGALQVGGDALSERHDGRRVPCIVRNAARLELDLDEQREGHLAGRGEPRGGRVVKASAGLEISLPTFIGVWADILCSSLYFTGPKLIHKLVSYACKCEVSEWVVALGKPLNVVDDDPRLVIHLFVSDGVDMSMERLFGWLGERPGERRLVGWLMRIRTKISTYRSR